MKLLVFTQKVDATDSNLGFFHRWLIEFSKQTEQVTVVCLEKGTYDLPENVRVVSLGKDESKGKLTYIYRLFAYSWKYRNEYDAVFVHMNPIYAALAGWFWRVLGKHVGLWYVHGARPLSLRLAACQAHSIMTASEKSLTLKTKKKRVLGHGIDTDLFAPTSTKGDSNVPRLITVGRISPVKGHKTLLEALALLKKKKLRFGCSIVGMPVLEEEKAYYDSLQQFVREQDLLDDVHFDGALLYEELAPKLGASDIFVHMSDHGGLDKASLEAMAAGLPIVSCNATLTGMVDDCMTGLMFPQGEAHAMAHSIETLLAMGEAERQKVGACLRGKIVESHNLKRLISAIVEQYKHN